MKPKILLCLALVLGGGLFGYSDVPNRIMSQLSSPAVSPAAQQVVRHISDYYARLNSFEGTNTIVAETPTYKAVDKVQFAFLRPNRFLILRDGTNGPQTYCDGTNFYNYEPYYYNSYTWAPAPMRFEEVITNRLGGELLLMILATNRFEYLMNGFGRGLTALKYDGREAIDGVDCDHVSFEEPQSKVMELWVARGAFPYAVKYAYSFPMLFTTNQTMHYTETISGWKGNGAIAPGEFIFAPSQGVVERPSDADQAEVSEITTNGTKKEVIRFYSSNEAGATAKEQADFLKKNQERFRAVALKSVLAKYADLRANDLVFMGIQPAGSSVADEAFVVTFALSKTMKTTEISRSVEISEDTISTTLSPEGNVETVRRGNSFSFRSK